MAKSARRCKECDPDARYQRPAPYPGPRCASHWRTEKRRRAEAAHEAYVQATYGLAPGEYEALYVGQGRRCWICQRATGASRRLSVDHNHRLGCAHESKKACRTCVRGLLCRRCNDLLAHVHDDTDVLYRALWYLANPPAQRILG